MFRFRLDGSSGVPPYLQIVHQVRQSLLLGYLREGDRLPTVTDVAGDLAINPNTVVKAGPAGRAGGTARIAGAMVPRRGCGRAQRRGGDGADRRGSP